ncbi:RsmB/NOP family class I SAM-dependent RNA methyltransferase [Deltaproteobacteria bacterium]|nr:RsmB/NOP family class I SAM-dependent RNA methyltransferase [Deltaproteobacteria bacterium]
MFEDYREIIPDFSSFLESLKRVMPLHIRVNTLKVRPEKLYVMLEEKGIHLKSTGDGSRLFFEVSGLKSPGNLLEYFTGYIHSQALTSCLASVALSPEDGCHVLDMCASPGGKSSHIAQLMQNSGLIVANELYPDRHIPLAHTLSRLGVLNTIFTAYQAQEFPLRQGFDYILADVPCSGEGRVRNPKEGCSGRWNGKITFRHRLLELQKKIIIRGFDLLKDKGVMLYATCTYNPDENESVVDFLLENRDAELLPIKLDFHYEPGLTRWREKIYDKRLQRTARFYPHRIDSVGFFMARIGRRRG